MTFLPNCVAVTTLQELDKEVSATVGLAWSDNTLKSRNSQWKKYFEFCITMGLPALPADVSTIARFLVYLSRTCKFSTINNYLSAINVVHKYHGYDIDFRKFYLTQLIIKGLKRQLGTKVDQSRPFSKDELICMYMNMDHASEIDLVLWSAVILSFRTLLRKSNYVPDSLKDMPHVLRREDVTFFDWGMELRVSSSKTIQHKQYVLTIPVRYVMDKRFCAVAALLYHFKHYPAGEREPLFINPKTGKPLIYRDLLAFIKRLATSIGIVDSRVGCHSLRRSGAAFMHSIGVPLEDIMSIGDWRSMAVLSYLATPMSRKKYIQDCVAEKLI